MKTVCMAMLALVVATPIAAQGQRFDGPYPGTVQRVIDGDTFVAEVEVWPNIYSRVSVRIRGLQAPERRGAACSEEQDAAEAATAILMAELYERNPEGLIELDNVEADVWSGRVVADVFRPNTARRTPLIGQLLTPDAQFFHAWTPEMDDVPWCTLLSDASD